MKRWFSALWLVSLFLIFLPDDGASANPNVQLYSVTSKDAQSQPYRLAKGGDIVGNIPARTVIEVTAIEGDWAKVNYKGASYYMWAAKLQKVAVPNSVMSPWAKKWLAEFDDNYYGIAGEWKNVKEDWTKPITRDEMAQILVLDIMEQIYGNWTVQFGLKGAFAGADELAFIDSTSYYPRRLLYWGVVSPGKFNGTKNITYGEFTDLLVKLMAYDKKGTREGGGLTFTKADIAKFNIEGNTKPDTKITMEQARILAYKTVAWWDAMNLLAVAKSDQAEQRNRGANVVGTGIYSIRTFIGTKPNLIINAQGKGELRNDKKQSFKITYKKNYPSIMLYTIQTMDGKYVALANGTKNGNQLITQNKEYLWVIASAGSQDGQFTQSMYAPLNKNQLLNASGWKTANGTPAITWFVENGTPKNAQWLFDYVGPIDKSKAAVPNPA